MIMLNILHKGKSTQALELNGTVRVNEIRGGTDGDECEGWFSRLGR